MRKATIVRNPFPHRDNFDLGMMAQRLSTVEDNHTELTEQISSLRDDLGRQVGDLRAGVDRQLADLNRKLDVQVAGIAAAKSTNWTSFWGSAAAVGGVVVVLGGAIITPMLNNLRDLAADVKQMPSMFASVSFVADNLQLIRARVGKLEDSNSNSEKQFFTIREHESYDAALKTRFELMDKSWESQHKDLAERVDMLSARITEAQDHAKP